MWRVIDSNLNRLREGLRVLEDIARFILNDPNLTRQLKAMRHSLKGPQPPLELLRARRAAEDVGAEPEAAEEQRADMLALVLANARRAQEALRVLEEFAKLPEAISYLDWAELKGFRFTLYSLEQELTARLLRQERRRKVSGLYVLVDPELARGRSEIEVTRQALAGGAAMIQLRDKRRSKGEILPLARELRRLCEEAGALFIVNDHADLAAAVNAHGLHVGQKDLPIAAVRPLLPLDCIVGRSNATLEEALRSQEEGADYVSVGAIFPTTSKDDARPAGLETLQHVAQQVSVPVVAIGGINETNVHQVMAAGATAVAVISAVVSADDVTAAARRLAQLIESSGQSQRT